MDNAKLIRTSLQATRQGLGLPGPLPDPWTGRLYQNANRLTHAQWLRDRGVQAFFAHLLFIDDPIEPTTANQWRDAIETADELLGLAEAEMPWAVHVCLPAGSYDDLTAVTG